MTENIHFNKNIVNSCDTMESCYVVSISCGVGTSIRSNTKVVLHVLVSVFQVSGKVTYNGHEMNEFVPERTAAYISQHDLHIGEMTVRETLAFSARCQGAGSRYGTLLNVV
jgi:hypothetical protein